MSPSVSSYDKGINGVILYVQDLPNDGANVGADDFNVLVGTTADIDTWTAGPRPQVTVTAGLARQVGHFRQKWPGGANSRVSTSG